MTAIKKSILFIFLLLAATATTLYLAAIPVSSLQTRQRAPVPPSRFEHAYHANPPRGPLPTTLDPQLFRDSKSAFLAYSLAARIRQVLYQEPCFCPCDEDQGHQSLLDCYTSDHGTVCPICKKEVVFIFEEYKEGKSAEAIREEIKKREWVKVDIEKYVAAHYDEYAQR